MRDDLGVGAGGLHDLGMAPVMTMVADRSGSDCLIAFAMARPGRSWIRGAPAPSTQASQK